MGDLAIISCFNEHSSPSSPDLIKLAASSVLFEKGKPINEVKRHRLQKLYQEYHQLYNKVYRPIQEAQPTSTYQGLVSWKE